MSSSDNEKNTADRLVTSSHSATDERRREALRKLAKFGAYTAPALLVMLASEKAVAQDTFK